MTDNMQIIGQKECENKFRYLRVLLFVLGTKSFFINYEQEWIIDNLVRQVMESCALLGYCEAHSGNTLQTFRNNLSLSPSRPIRYVGPKRQEGIITIRCVITQKIADLIYFAAEA